MTGSQGQGLEDLEDLIGCSEIQNTITHSASGGNEIKREPYDNHLRTNTDFHSVCSLPHMNTPVVGYCPPETWCQPTTSSFLHHGSQTTVVSSASHNNIMPSGSGYGMKREPIPYSEAYSAAHGSSAYSSQSPDSHMRPHSLPVTPEYHTSYHPPLMHSNSHPSGFSRSCWGSAVTTCSESSLSPSAGYMTDLSSPLSQPSSPHLSQVDFSSGFIMIFINQDFLFILSKLSRNLGSMKLQMDMDKEYG